MKYIIDDIKSLLSRLFKSKDNLAGLLVLYLPRLAIVMGVVILLQICCNVLKLPSQYTEPVLRILMCVLPIVPTLAVWRCRDSFGGESGLTDGIMDACFVIWCIILIFSLSVFGISPQETEDALDSAYQAGYDAGILDGKENGYGNGNYEGLNESHSISIDDLESTIREISRDAEYYAMENSEYDAETAMAIIDSYLNNKPDYFGDMHTEEEFRGATLTLYKFYEYYYGNHYNVDHYN